jgi:hypothetical protein
MPRIMIRPPLAPLAGLFAILAVLLPGPAFGGEAEDAAMKEAAAQAALTWLPIVDKGDYAESWKQAAPPFQTAVTEEKWVAMAASTRQPLGANEARKLVSQAVSTNPPGAPEGTYIVCQFQSSFENMKFATETVSLFRLPDGTWKVVGYYIRPR